MNTELYGSTSWSSDWFSAWVAVGVFSFIKSNVSIPTCNWGENVMNAQIINSKGSERQFRFQWTTTKVLIMAHENHIYYKIVRAQCKVNNSIFYAKNDLIKNEMDLDSILTKSNDYSYRLWYQAQALPWLDSCGFSWNQMQLGSFVFDLCSSSKKQVKCYHSHMLLFIQYRLI